MGIKRVVLLPDIHHPHHNKEAIKAVFQFIRYFKPHAINILGDALNMDAVNHWKQEKGSKKYFEGKRLLKEYEAFDKPSFPCLDEAKKKETLEEKVKAVVFGDDEGSKFVWECTASALTYCANRIPEIADSLVEIDNAMKWGYGWEIGPFESWDAIGVKESVERMEKIALHLG